MSNAAIQGGQREIPGFYYDQTRKRYFRVAHTASGGQYTASSIAKRNKTEKAAEKAAQLSDAHAKVRATRRQLSLTLGYDTTLGRSLGNVHTVDRERVFAHHLKRDVHRSRLLSTAGYRTKIAYNSESVELYVAASRFIEAHSLATDVEDMFSPISQHSLIHRMMPIAPLRSSASSLTFSAGTLLGTSVGEAHRPAEVIIKNAYGGKITTVDGTLWCSAVRPKSTHFAAAGSTVLLFDIVGADDTRQEIKIKGKTDVMAMDFLDTNVLTLGCRNGSVHLYDVRTKNSSTSMRFRHGDSHVSGIASIRASSRHSLLVSGLNHSLSLYDMRFLRPSKAFVDFHGHRNEYDMSVNAMAICNNILFVAQEGHDIKLWNLHGVFLTTITTEYQVDDLCFPEAAPGEHDTMWSMSHGRLDQWRFNA